MFETFIACVLFSQRPCPVQSPTQFYTRVIVRPIGTDLKVFPCCLNSGDIIADPDTNKLYVVRQNPKKNNPSQWEFVIYEPSKVVHP